MLNRDQLDELSRMFAEKLFEKYPEWEAAARHNAEQPLSFYVECESPVKGRLIGCSTENGEITIFFGDWHGHYGGSRLITDEESVEDALQDIADIVSDSAVVEAVCPDGVRLGTVLRRVGEEDPWSNVRPSLLKKASTIEIRIQSWSGRLDAVSRT